MAKNMKSTNSKLAKLFLLGCANAAIMTSMSSNAIADISVADIIARKVEFINLAPQAQFADIKNLVAEESFKTVLDADRRALIEIVERDFDPQNTGLGNNAFRKEKDALIKGIEEAPRERVRNNRIGLPMVGMQAHEPAARNLELGAGFNKPKTAIEENEILNTILKDNAFAALQEQAKNIQIQRKLEVIPANLDRIKTIIVDELPESFKKAALNNLLNSELSHNEVKHILFKNNFLDKNVREDKKSFEYSEIGNSPLFIEINEMDTVTVKQKEDLLKAYKGYVNNNFAEIHAQRPNDTAIKRLANLMDEERLAKYLTAMVEITLDSFEKDIDGEKPLDRKALAEYNKILKEVGVITEDLSNSDMKSLIKGFNTKTMNKLAISLEDTKKEDANKRLVSLTVAPVGGVGAPPPPPPPPGGRIAGGGIPAAPAMMANAAFDITNLTRINGLDAALSNDLSGKLKEFYNLFTDFEKNKGAIQKERNEQKAELAKQKEEQKKKRETDLLAAEEAYFNGLTEAEKQQYEADKEATQKLIKDYQVFYTVIHTDPKKKPEENKAPNPAAILLGVQQDIAPIIRMMLTNNIIETQIKPGLQAAIDAGNIDINALSEQYNDKLSKLFSVDNPNRADIEAQVKSTYALLVKDKGLNQRARAIVANEDFFANLLNEEEEQKAVRLDWVLKNVPESMQAPITKEKVKTATLLELEKIASAIEKIEFINTKSDILGNDVLNNQVKDIVNKFNDLSFNDKVNLVVNKNNINNKINTVEPQTLNDLNTAKTNWLGDGKNITQLLVNTAINLVDLKAIEKKPEVNVNQLMDFYNILAVTKANLMDSKTDLTSAQISENEITPQVQKAFSKALSSEQDRNANRITTEYDKKAIVSLVSRINAKDLLKKFEEFKNQNRIADLDGIKDALDKLKTSEKDLADKRKAARDAAAVPVVIVPAVAVKEIESDIGKKIQGLMQIAEAEAVAANNNAERNAAAEQMRLKTQTQKVVNKALALALSKSEIDKAIADNGNCDEETLGRITKEAERVLDNEYQGNKNELFVNMENTLNEQYKVILADEGLVAFLQENNKDFIEKIQNVVGEVAAVIPVAPIAVAPVNVAVAVPVAPAPVVINAEDREEGLPLVAEGGAEEVEVAPPVAVIAPDPDAGGVAEDVDGRDAPVEPEVRDREVGEAEALDAGEAHDEEGGEAVERPVVLASAGLMPPTSESKSKDSEASLAASKKEEQEKARKEEEKLAAAKEEAKCAEEIRIAEVARIEVEEVATIDLFGN